MPEIDILQRLGDVGVFHGKVVSIHEGGRKGYNGSEHNMSQTYVLLDALKAEEGVEKAVNPGRLTPVLLTVVRFAVRSSGGHPAGGW